ncbi:MAG: leucyl/phenylalanyl-tRNA--protein transferase [Kangiellaceae bacterium]|nr:leucyl/phenylalanyl-tRNA--protein transferase [Kangiellaceae bacterium]
MLPYLTTQMPFPPVNKALNEPNGLLAAGGDLSAERLIQAYSHGIFPWYSEGEPILWWSPDPRMVFFIDRFKVRRSVKQTLKRNRLAVTLNSDFEQVMRRCSLPRSEENGTWITEEMILAYCNLHALGRAHSVEVWQYNELDDKQNRKLVGGIYGVNVNGVFCGESMFSEISNGSKIALSGLVKYLQTSGFKLVDCQIENPHLSSLGAINISRKLYLNILKNSKVQLTQPKDLWQERELNWQKLFTSK